ncbi:rod shape-determining protein [Bacillales bacterium AN1005]
MFARDIGIDLGTANVLIHVKGKGIVLNEPSVVALDKNSGRVLAVGEEARRMVGRRDARQFVKDNPPVKGWGYCRFKADVTESMLKHFINKLNVKGFLSKPRILICCPTNITSVEQKAIKENRREKSGGKKIYLRKNQKLLQSEQNGYLPAAKW